MVKNLFIEDNIMKNHKLVLGWDPDSVSLCIWLKTTEYSLNGVSIKFCLEFLRDMNMTLATKNSKSRNIRFLPRKDII
jgi:hypothetical protein